MDNSDNVYLDGTIYMNEWNSTLRTLTTSTQKDRIHGKGNYIGGNDWTRGLARGHSDTCIDAEKDGICVEPWDVEHSDTDCSDTDNCDWLPLSGILTTEGPVTFRITFKSRMLKIFRSVL